MTIARKKLGIALGAFVAFSLVGVAALPGDAAVEVDGIFEVA